ncbi:hypothetical protein ACFFTN_25415 [Aminobacter aganoensis]|uniref:Uncharacterized protein n=1 Tax=Aminobacter aganoensis TaxID=83264 RepID=A0A7X0F7J0_9HYPH|nr:hypothetical protein [Aminobacter aganoensis]MBB6354606.1 hypothetical protein [Aminobacter aganoensis]
MVSHRLRCTSAQLRQIAHDIVGYQLAPYPQLPSFARCRLLHRNGGITEVRATDLDVADKFEVWTLALSEMAVPAELDFVPWPFETWSVQVLVSDQYVVRDRDPHPELVGTEPFVHFATRPGTVPAGAISRCRVDRGLLFEGASGKHLAIAADWFPMNLFVSEDEKAIEEYVADSLHLDLEAYLRSRG